MPRFSGLFIVVATLTGCAYHNPTAPTPPPVSDVAPAFLTLSVPTSNNGAVIAYVQNAHGAPLSGVVVQFTSTAGDLSPTAAQTAADGRASTTLTASSDARVVATAGALTARATVAAPVTPPVPVTPTPPPGPPPSPAPPPPSVVLNVSSAATTGVSLLFNVSSVATGVTWTWTFGDGATAQTTAYSTSHTYTAAGNYTATVSGSGTPSASATITVTNPPPPTTPPATTLVASMACTAGTHGLPGVATATTCNLSMTYGGNAVTSGSVTRVDWDWGDGTATYNGGVVSKYTYPNPGTYTVVALVAANTADGSKSATTSKVITVP
jgi:PKD repeat protein